MLPDVGQAGCDVPVLIEPHPHLALHIVKEPFFREIAALDHYHQPYLLSVEPAA
jgi:hypothetical protein